MGIKGLYFDGELNYREDLIQPVPAAGEALIRIRLSAICNTDLELMKGYNNYQGILGHEFVGKIEESNNPELIGQRVVGDINIGCGNCSFCLQGLNNHCPYRQVLGIQNKDGTFAEYITLPEVNLFPVPDAVSDQEAVLTEPLAAALEITNQVHIQPPQKVAVIGDGKLSFLITQVLALTGCDLIVIGKHQENLKRLKEFAEVEYFQEIKRNNQFDCIVECAGNEAGLQLAEELIKPRGTIVLKSTYVGSPGFNPSGWVVNEVTLVGSRCGPMDSALRLLEKKLVKVYPIIGRYYSLADYQEAFSTKFPYKVSFDITE